MPVIINSVFTPMTYDEITKPLLELTAAQLAMEESYLEANDKASRLMALANLQTDPITYNKLKLFAEDLKAQADNLVANGLLTGSRNALLNMKRRYLNEINPIELAAARREEFAKELRELALKDLTLRFSTDYNNVSLDDMIKNSSLMNSYATLSGNLIMQKTAALAKQYGDAIESEPQFENILNGQYYQVMKNHGYSPALIVALAHGDPNAPKELRMLSDSIHELIADNAAYNRDWVLSYINQGMAAALGKTDYDVMLNRNFSDYGERRRLDLEEERLNMSKPVAPEYRIPTDDGHYLDPNTGFIFDGNTKDSKIILGATAKKGLNTSTPTELAKLGKQQLITKPIYFKGDNAVKIKGDSFNVEEAELYDIEKLTPNLKAYINSQLIKFGLTLEDVDIYVDKDFGRNDYKIVPKGYNVDGSLKEEPIELNFEE